MFNTVRFSTLLFLVQFKIFAQAPDFQWISQAGGTGQKYAEAIDVDENGNSYVTGKFEGSVTFGNTTLTSSGYEDIFIAKYDAFGNLLWANKAGGSTPDIGNGIAVDGSGNCYVAGQFTGIATFGNTTLSTNGSWDIFIAKYTTSGDLIWVKNAGGVNNDFGRGITVDRTGNCFVTGSFAQTANFGNTILTSSGNSDIFIAKYDSSGNMLWVNQSEGIGWGIGKDVAVDSSGNSFLTGWFSETISFGTTSLTSNGSMDMFISKYDLSGNVVWVRQAGGMDQDYSNGIAIDISGNSYIVGVFWFSATFGNITVNSNGYTAGSIAKFDDSGNLVWVRLIDGPDGETVYDVATDNSGNILIIGSFAGLVTLGSNTLHSNGYSDAFIAKYDASGGILWVTGAGGADSDIGSGMAVDENNNCYITGLFFGSATFGSTTLTSSGGADIFTAKLSSLTSLPDEPATTSLSTYPNPFTSSFQLSLTSSEPAQVFLSDMLGREVHHQVITLSKENTTATITPPGHLQPGMYLLQLQQGETTKQVRVVRQ